jgi:hypothetical protein
MCAMPFQISDRILTGAHWAMADPALAIERRIKGRKERMALEQYQHGHSTHNWHVTEADILAQCAAHANDGRMC